MTFSFTPKRGNFACINTPFIPFFSERNLGPHRNNLIKLTVQNYLLGTYYTISKFQIVVYEILVE